MTPIERFWTKVDKTEPGGCWLWTAYRNHGGYGVFGCDGRTFLAHRWIYEQVVGVIGDGKQIDHLCRVRNCVNPDHLEAVSCRENVHRSTAPAAANREKTHCKHGHPLSGSNLYVEPNGRRRVCRTCKQEAMRRFYERHGQVAG